MNDTNKHDSPWIVETRDATFQQDVIERSHELPVVVDFWAAWCQPCRLLAPLIEQLAAEMQGRFLLVKANTDDTPQAATALGVQGIPAVFALVGGQVVDYFAGLLSETQLREWVERVVQTGDLQRAQRLEAADPEAAETLYQEILQRQPELAAARIGQARLHLAQGRRTQAQQAIEQLEDRGFLEPEAQKIKAALEIGEKQGIDLAAAEAAARAAPDDLERQVQWGEALAAHGRHEEALATLLSVVERQKTGAGDRARALMIDIFRILPEDSSLTADFRRKLASALY